MLMSKSMFRVLIITVLSVFVFSGCALLEGGKKELEGQLAICKADKEKLSKEKAECEKKEAECQAKTAQKGIPVILFGGDIMYEVAVEAFKDYKAGLRFRTLNDPNFQEKSKMFEEGKGGDSEMLAVLKEVDKNADKIIDASEASGFRKAEEDKYSTSPQK